MKPSSILSRAVALAALATASSYANGGHIEGTSSGLFNPGVTITFEPPPTIAPNAAVTTQYSGSGVTFDYLYYHPFDPDNVGQYTSITDHYAGNYQFTQEEFEADPDAPPVSRIPTPLTISFSNVQTRAAFGLRSNGGGDGNGDGDVFTFTAFLSGVQVDAFNASVRDGYYGFLGDQPFDRITIASCVPTFDEEGNTIVDCNDPYLSLIANRFGPATEAIAQIDPLLLLVNPDFYLFDNLQFDAAAVNPAAVPEPQIAALFCIGLFGAAALRRRSARLKPA